MTNWQKAVTLAQGFALFGFYISYFVFSLSSPVPDGVKNRKETRPFLKALFPDREVSPPDSLKAPVAVLYHLIRSGDSGIARQAIEFAEEKEFGLAAPFVIGRLGSGDPELEGVAQNFLRKIAGGDFGPDPESWRAWWRDPPRHLFGLVPVGQETFAYGVPAALALGGLLVMVAASGLRRLAFFDWGNDLWCLSFVFAYHFYFILISHLMGPSYTCTFGPIQITYFASKYSVFGLEDGGPIWVVSPDWLVIPLFIGALFLWILLFLAWAYPAGFFRKLFFYTDGQTTAMPRAKP